MSTISNGPLFAAGGMVAAPSPELAVERIERAAVILIALAVASGVVHVVSAWAELGNLPLKPMLFAPRGLGILMSVGLIALIRSKRVAPQALCDLGLTYHVLIAGLMAWMNLMLSDISSGSRVALVAIWILLFGVIVPTTVPRAAVAAVTAASTVPAALGIWALVFGSIPQGRTEAVLWILESYVGAGLAVFSSYTLYRLGREVARAQQLGSYRLEVLLGKGGMGEVWKASHHLLKRPAAIKLVSADLLAERSHADRQNAIHRFTREATATASLSSPHTIQLYDFGVSGDGRLFYVMELLDGLDLHQLVTRYGPVPAARAIHLIRQAAVSLQDAHDIGLIHRDIKPSNLFVCRLGRATDFLKVLDFGLVRSLDRSRDAQQLTQEGAVNTTPTFMAPETVLTPDAVDHRADVYQLGCVLFWLLTGQVVFPRDTSLHAALAHAQAALPTPSSVLQAPLPPGLDEFILQCLKKDPNQRPPSMEQVIERLDAIAVASWDSEVADTWWRDIYGESSDKPRHASEPTFTGVTLNGDETLEDPIGRRRST